VDRAHPWWRHQAAPDEPRDHGFQIRLKLSRLRNRKQPGIKVMNYKIFSTESWRTNRQFCNENAAI
jgi:hypothetical protein